MFPYVKATPFERRAQDKVTEPIMSLRVYKWDNGNASGQTGRFLPRVSRSTKHLPYIMGKNMKKT
jgi:hypothetical protein